MRARPRTNAARKHGRNCSATTRGPANIHPTTAPPVRTGLIAKQAQEKQKAGVLYRDQGIVFAGEGGGFIDPSNLHQRAFTPLLKRAGLSWIIFNDLRHTCASLLFQRNVHAKFVQDLLGHASVAITLDTYSHMLPGMGGEAAEAKGATLGDALR